MGWKSAVVAAMTCAFMACAQTGTGSIQGTVKDGTGAMVPGAKISIVHTETAQENTTVANGTGFFLFPAVQRGAYVISVAAAGMETWRGRLDLQTGQTAEIDAVLQVGQTRTEVTVAGDITPLVNTSGPTLSNTVERERIEQLPINGRAFQTLVQETTPGLEGASQAPMVWGIRWGAEFLQDGAVMLNRNTGELSGRPPGLDTIQEFRVESNNSSAKMNRPGTVIVNTRAGTNQVHGAAFETARNSGLGVARRREDYYSKPPHFVRNEFGASLGGPVYVPKIYNGRNRTFFFFAWESSRQLQSPTTSVSMPTVAMRQGDFSGLFDTQGRHYTLYDPWSTGAAPAFQRVPWPGNQISLSRESPLAKYLYSITPLPNVAGVNPLAGPNYFAPSLNNTRQYTVSTRIDQRISERDQLFWRFSDGFRNQQQAQGPNGSPITLDHLANGNWQNYRDVSGVFSWNHTFSPTFFSELVFNASSEDNNLIPLGQGVDVADQLGLPNPFQWTGFPNINTTGFGMEYVAGINGRNYIDYIFNLDDNLTKIHGRHELQFGFRIRYERLNTLPDQQFVQGQHNFSGTATGLFDPTSGNQYLAVPFTGFAAGDLFLGVANSYSAQFCRRWYYMSAREQSAYFQDNFRATGRLTLNLGVRYEFYSPITEQNNVLTGFDEKSHAIVDGASFDTMYKAGATIPAIVNAYQALGVKFETPQQAGLPQHLIHGNYLDFNPRAGFAWRMSGGRHPLVARGGYAVFGYPMPINQFNQRMRANPPTTAQFITFFNSAATSPDGHPNYLLRSAPAVVAGVNSSQVLDVNHLTVIPGNFMIDYFDPHQPTSRAHEWNFTLEKEILDNDLVRVSYVGTHGARLDNFYSFNEAPNAYIWYATTGLPVGAGLTAGVSNRPFDNTVLGTIEKYMKIGWSNAQNLQIEFQRRYARGYAFQAFYVHSNAFRAGGRGWQDEIIPSTAVFFPGAVPADLHARNRFLNYTRDTDIPQHRVRWNWIVDLPFGKGKPLGRNANRMWNRIIGGWQVAGSGTMTSRWWSLPVTNFGQLGNIQVYGTKYPVQDCRSGVCYAGYLYYNGYIPANRINSYDPKTGRPNGVMGVPANYVPSSLPVLPTPATGGSPGDPNYAFYETNTVYIRLQTGTLQRTAINTNLHPWRNQYLPGPMLWNMDASLFKAVPLRERVTLRFNADFFNVLNMPGIGLPNALSGIITNQLSVNAARNLQLTLRLNW